HGGQRDAGFVGFGVLAVGALGALGRLGFFLLAGLLALGLSVRAAREVGLDLGGFRTAAIGGVKIDDVAQQHLAGDQPVAPGDERLVGERAFADAADHHVAAGLDALGDGDLALARQQFDAAHLAQVHAHGVVGAADIVVVDIAGRRRLLFLRRFGC